MSLPTVLALMFTTAGFGQNLLLNGSFEEKDANNNAVGSHWVLYNGAEVWAKQPNQIPLTVQDGSYSLAAKALSGVLTVGAYQILSTSPEAEWSFTGWALNSEHSKLGLGCHGLAQMDFLGADGSVKLSIESPPLAQQLGWDDFSIYGTAPSDATSVRLGVLLHQTSNPSGVLSIDALEAGFVTPVPELGAAGWLAVGMAGMAIAMRKRIRRAR